MASSRNSQCIVRWLNCKGQCITPLHTQGPSDPCSSACPHVGCTTVLACCLAVVMTPSTGGSGTIRILCTKPTTPAGWESFTLTLNTSTATEGVANCGDTRSTDVPVQVNIKPVVTVSSDSAPGVCSDSPNSISTFTVSNDRETELAVSLAGPAGWSCAMTKGANTAVANEGR